MGRVMYVGGTFDLPHAGHVALLRRAAELGEVVVSLNRDEFCARYKRQPVMTLAERAAVIGELRCVSRVVVNSGDEDSRPAVLEAGATHVVHGDDWTGEALMRQMSLTPDWLREHGVEMLYLPYTPGVSTSAIIERCRGSA